jgi:hypothetical protein
MPLFPVVRNTNVASSSLGEIFIIAAPDDFEWVEWMRDQIVATANPVLTGFAVCTPLNWNACSQSPAGMLDATRQARRFVFPSTARFDQPGPHREAFAYAWGRMTTARSCAVVPVKVDAYMPDGVLAGSKAINLVGLKGAELSAKFIDGLARTVARPSLPATPPPYPGALRS